MATERKCSPMANDPRGLGEIWPNLAEFRELARDRRVIPVVRRLLADAETPIGLYRKLAEDGPGTFLFESAEHDGTWARYSFIGASGGAVLTSHGDQACWIGEPPIGVPTSGPVADVLAQTLDMLHTPRVPGMPRLSGGLVGMVGYDIVRHWEKVPSSVPDELGLPVLSLIFTADLAVFDHADSTILLIANAINHNGTDENVDEAWSASVARLESMSERLRQPTPATVARYQSGEQPAVTRCTLPEDFVAAVESAQGAIRDGEVFQVVLSQRFDVECQADALDVYRCLRASNPSPYMYLVRCVDGEGGRFDVVGSSPEALVKVEGNDIVTHPIAGTRPRGASPKDDNDFAEDLSNDVKENAEHLMLVDLSRNDVAKIAHPGSVEVVDFRKIERYSHVMHMVSTVTGQLDPQHSAYDVLRATFPAGTLSGAPKPRSLTLIEELEPARRGVYGGTVGYFDFDGDFDMAIAIRTAVIRGGVAHVQAGAGIVADSVPEAEQAECEAKAAAVVQAIGAAATMCDNG